MLGRGQALHIYSLQTVFFGPDNELKLRIAVVLNVSQTSNISITWELVKNANSWASTKSETQGVRPSSLCFHKLSR